MANRSTAVRTSIYGRSFAPRSPSKSDGANPGGYSIVDQPFGSSDERQDQMSLPLEVSRTGASRLWENMAGGDRPSMLL